MPVSNTPGHSGCNSAGAAEHCRGDGRDDGDGEDRHAGAADEERREPDCRCEREIPHRGVYRQFRTRDRVPARSGSKRVRMFRENWRSLAFWRWWWRTSVSPEVKVPLALAVVAGLLVGGYVAAGHLSGASASPEASSYVVARTVQRVVTVHDQGTTRVKKVPVVVNKTVVRSRTQTAYQVQTYMSTRVVTVPGP